MAGPLPSWADCDPSEDGVPPTELPVRLSDITHHAEFPGQTVTVYSPSHASGRPCDIEILHGSIDCIPFAEQPACRVPVVNLRLTDDCWITDRTPDGLAALSAQLRSQADRLDREIRPALITARSDWTEWTDQRPDRPPPHPRWGLSPPPSSSGDLGNALADLRNYRDANRRRFSESAHAGRAGR
ncbi:hypothetical protein RVR_5515 [Actinacidiphila reveromycinica]|uniref:Uncharacterized protein n=1 Tax=Actinacidiphila reveromycinica TaxID=659352 RepID=A0A7U3VPV0_9ACTN|nr:hypothetical protein [Streptomyces sp. SN-593]BBA99054.1 hypothetical protein RVR_5515 [Streptomyces sp. SN-593]